MNKYKIFRTYYKISIHPTNENRIYCNHLLNIIVQNGWLEEYNKLYPNEFGL